MPAPETAVSITVNGEPRGVPAGLALPELLRRLDLDPARSGVAVARNGTVVRRADWPETEIADGDDLEVITATQGG